jgi:hypothetical protein
MKFVKNSDFRLEIFFSSLSVLLNTREIENRRPTVHTEQEEEVILRGDNDKENAGGF